jgi:hypothetical protein
MSIDILIERKNELESARVQAINNYNVLIGQLGECEHLIITLQNEMKAKAEIEQEECIDEDEIPPVG